MAGKSFKKITFFGVIFLILFIFTGFLSYKFWSQKKFNAWLNKRKIILSNLENEILKETDSFNQHYGILIKDFKSGYKIGLNEEVLFPSASLVKIPIMACVYCADKENRINLNQKIVLKASDITPGAGVLKNAPLGKEFDLEELVRLMIAYSDNTATNILIELLGFDYLNSCFKNLGLKDTNISRKILDNRARDRGYENYTTAQDIGHLLEMFYKRQFISKDVSERCLEFLKQQKLRDRIPALLPVDVAVAHKTGLENGVCHDAGIIFSKEGDFLICILTRHNLKTAQPAKHFISRVAQRLYLAFNKDE